MLGLDDFERRHSVDTGLLGIGAAGVKPAAGRRRGEIGWGSRDGGKRLATALPGGQGGEQGRGVGVLGMREQRRCFCKLGDAPGIHHRDPVAGLGDDAEIMGDEQHAHREFLPEPQNELQDLILDSDIERRRRLVGNQEPRPPG